MGDLVNPHATLFLPVDAAAEIAAVRRRWDPRHAASIAAHLTLAYPWEIGNLAAMARAAATAVDAGPIRLELDGLRLVAPGGPLVIEAIDVDGTFARARVAGVGPEAASRVEPHVTLVHPGTSDRAAEAWDALRDWRVHMTVAVDTVSVTAFDGERWRTVREYPAAASHRAS
jgi:2'-5' RNA ligase